jgi:hypothetical protein
MRDVRKKLIVWFIFSALFPIVPTALGTLSSFLFGTPTSFIDVFRSGELLYAAAGISAAALGEALLTNTSKFRSATALLIGMDLLSVSFCLFLGAWLSQSSYDALPHAEDFYMTVAWYTALSYLFAVGQGAASVYFSTVANE